MKKLLTMIILFLVLAPIISAQNTPATSKVNNNIDASVKDLSSGIAIKYKNNNPWNETTTISPVWQTIIGEFFGLNLHGKSDKISVREAIVFFGVFIMFFLIISDILKLIPFFEKKIFDVVSAKLVAALIITTIASITGTFINLKNIFLSSVDYLVKELNFDFMNNAVNNFWGTIFISFAVVVAIFVVNEIFSWIEPIAKKLSQISRAEAKGRLISDNINNNNNS